MKIEQNKKFEPITLVLETKEEANALWDMARGCGNENMRALQKALSDYFSNVAQLGG